VLSAYVLSLRNREKILRENILKCLYHLGETDRKFQASRSMDEILEKRPMQVADLKRGIKYLQWQRLATRKGGKIGLTEKGVEAGQRITKIHRLWELYLTKYMDLPADHVHDDAEAIEHIITPELEKELEHQLAYPVIDPHDEPIPYKLGERD
jgi:manganese/zinc/iron transport system permease protein